MLKTSEKDQYSTMISMNDIFDWDELIEAHQALYLLDSCFSGLAGTTTQGINYEAQRINIEQMDQKARHLLTAGTEGQKTFASDRLGGSVFTAAVLDALNGGADSANKYGYDGLVSFRELVAHITTYIADECEKHKQPIITPQPRDLRRNKGQFFFLTGEKKKERLIARGLRPTGTFEYGEPVTMSGVPPEPVEPITEPEPEFPIRQAQIYLMQLGLNPGPADGIFGPATREALRRFQRRKGLSVTGELGQETWTALIQAVSNPPSVSHDPFTNSVGMTFVYIEPGSYMMGSNDGISNEKPVHRVNLTQGLYMQNTEVTQGQWHDVMGTKPWSGKQYAREGRNHAASYVSWDDAQEFIRKLNAKEGTEKYRLPTEAQWEYACSAGSGIAKMPGTLEKNMPMVLDRKSRINGDCMICMGMSGNGVRIGMGIIPRVL